MNIDSSLMNFESRHVFNLLFYLRITESSVGIPLLMKKTSDNDLSHILLREKLSLLPLLPLQKRYSLELVSLKALESRGKKKGWHCHSTWQPQQWEPCHLPMCIILHSAETNSDSLQSWPQTTNKTIEIIDFASWLAYSLPTPQLSQAIKAATASSLRVRSLCVGRGRTESKSTECRVYALRLHSTGGSDGRSFASLGS